MATTSSAFAAVVVFALVACGNGPGGPSGDPDAAQGDVESAIFATTSCTQMALDQALVPRVRLRVSGDSLVTTCTTPNGISLFKFPKNPGVTPGDFEDPASSDRVVVIAADQFPPNFQFDADDDTVVWGEGTWINALESGSVAADQRVIVSNRETIVLSPSSIYVAQDNGGIRRYDRSSGVDAPSPDTALALDRRTAAGDGMGCYYVQPPTTTAGVTCFDEADSTTSAVATLVPVGNGADALVREGHYYVLNENENDSTTGNVAGHLWMYTAASGSLADLGEVADGHWTALAANSTDLFFTDRESETAPNLGRIYQVPLGVGDPSRITQLADAVGFSGPTPAAIAADDDAVYWIERGVAGIGDPSLAGQALTVIRHPLH